MGAAEHAVEEVDRLLEVRHGKAGMVVADEAGQSL